jgi:alpha-L-fucosidase
MVLDFGHPVVFNCFMAQEYIRLGQRVKAFTVEGMVDGSWKELARGTTIGYRRILRFPAVRATRLRLHITDSKACPVISNVGVFDVPLVLTAPEIRRSRTGEITIHAADSASEIYYTLDGSIPTSHSKKYAGPVDTDGKLEVTAVAVDPLSGKSSPVSREQFDVPHASWKVVGTDDAKAAAVIDGDPHTAWHQHGKKMPVDLVIDLGRELKLTGFRYLPDQGSHAGVITRYRLSVSEDGEQWQVADEGEFSNIDNNPLWQVKKFSAVTGRYIKLQALHNARGDDDAGYAEIDVVTE